MTFRNKLCWTLISLATAQAATAQDRVSDAHDALATIATEAARKSKAGVVLEVQGCGIEFREARGVANRKTKTPMPINEELRIGSIGKLYTAAVIHHLVREDVLSLDTAIVDYLGTDIEGVPNSEATLRQLLNHTSGIPDYYDTRSYLSWDWEKPLTPERALSVARRRKPTNKPGEAYSYSNTNYQLLGMAAEKMSGKPLGTLMDEVIFTPLKLKETHYHISHPGGTIHGYGTVLRSRADTWKYAENTGADSGITASSRELTLFLKEVFLDEGALKELGNDMQSSRVPADRQRREDGAGAEFYIGRSGRELVGHTGDTFGYLSFAFAIPDYQATMVAHISASKEKAFSTVLVKTVGVLRETCAQ